ncbi:hypothetical protein [Rickettsiales endosymbiont of Stachyamoeba lipophora]|uniref:hypothetical protein n=1 Tax=Rickettsiales endosymbiont of Stachyamoeba lipophora TaxID=2486578 RepID=UPI000F64E0AF|nr:hypothetical protein [Rickettsiales endosymbiont of Stachyamoeba lipophora]AZL16286.1 hypothetical protein EF513_07080 [Rickettsiales endosymbiont of Stachyamoeba lipophora]
MIKNYKSELFSPITKLFLTKTKKDKSITAICKEVAIKAHNLALNNSNKTVNEYQDAVLSARLYLSASDQKMNELFKAIETTYPQNQQIREANAILAKEIEFDKAILQNRQAQTNQDIKELKQGGLVQDKANQSVIYSMLRDRNIVSQSEFSQIGIKQNGVSAGYAAKEAGSEHTFMLKQFYKKAQDCKTPQDHSNRRDGLNELIAADLYATLLSDRAPKEALVTPDKANDDSLYVRSKFFTDAKLLSEFSGMSNSHFNPLNPKLQSIEGFLKRF